MFPAGNGGKRGLSVGYLFHQASSWCSMVTQLHGSKMRLQNQAPLHVLTDTHTHGRHC